MLTNENPIVNSEINEVNNSHFHPDHLEDLRKSGLTDQTIFDGKIYSLRPGDFSKILGGLARKVDSMLAFPYPGNGFTRYKLFPSPIDGEGHRQKYFQPKGSGVHLYFPSGVKRVFSNPSIPLTLVEGEKKSLRANQEGIPCIGLGGVWSWCKPGTYELIADFDKIKFEDRKVNIVFDSPDIISNSNVQLAAFRLAKALREKGAVPYLMILPFEKGEKCGLDDFLNANSLKEFFNLKRVLLTEEIIEKEIVSQLIHRELNYKDVSTAKSPSLRCGKHTIKVFDLEGDSTKTLNFSAPCRAWDCAGCYPYLLNHWLEIVLNNFPERKAFYSILNDREWETWKKAAEASGGFWFRIFRGTAGNYLFLSNVPVKDSIPVSGQQFDNLLKKYLSREAIPLNGRRKITHSQNIELPEHLKNPKFEDGSGKRRRVAVIIPATLKEVIRREEEMGGRIKEIVDDNMVVMESPESLIERYRAMARGKIVPTFSIENPLQRATILGKV